jgi:para-nitrobenzyl esterase
MRCLAALLLLRAAGAAPTVRTAQGDVVGKVDAPGVERFAGIPFALPPIGERRFARAEENTAPWGSLDATRPGAPCVQNPLGDPRPPTGDESPPPSEDCLTLNLWRPAGASKPLPVMVYFFGGGLCAGYAASGHQNGSALARRDVVVVTVSYRLGALGFMPLDDFEGGGSGGMNGVFDGVVALRWLQRNVGAFGGDPAAVTIFGQSSGGYLACTLSVAPAAKGLFARAILQSGPCIGGPPGKGWGPGNLSFGLAVAAEVRAALNASSLAQLRAVGNASSIQWPGRYMNDLDVAPYFSGYFDDAHVAPPPLETAWAAGRINPASLVVGHVSKDGTAGFYGTAPYMGLVPPDPKQTSEADYEKAMRFVWGGRADAVLAQYPLGRFGGSAQAAFVQADADAFVICPSYELSALAAAAGRAVYAYEFAHFLPGAVDSPPAQPLGWGCDNGPELDIVDAAHVTPGPNGSVTWATHGGDVPFVFGTADGPQGLGPPNYRTHCPFGAAAPLAEAMATYWTGFAARGDPSAGCGGAGCVPWPRYELGTGTSPDGYEQTLLLRAPAGGGIAPASRLHTPDCAFWAKFGREARAA